MALFGLWRQKARGLGREGGTLFSFFLQLLFPSLAFSPGMFTMVSSPGFATYEMKIGAVTFQIATGDITKEKADVIVNSTTRTFNLKSGILFKHYA